MTSDVGRAKFTRYFHAMDSTGEGLIREEDYLATADRVTSVPQVEPEAELARMKAEYARNWSGIAQADADGDHAVTVDEWVDLPDGLPEARPPGQRLSLVRRDHSRRA